MTKNQNNEKQSSLYQQSHWKISYHANHENNIIIINNISHLKSCIIQFVFRLTANSSCIIGSARPGPQPRPKSVSPAPAKIEEGAGAIPRPRPKFLAPAPA